MKKITCVFLTVLLAVLLITLVSCPAQKETEESELVEYSKEFWGEWKSIGNFEGDVGGWYFNIINPDVYITSNDIFGFGGERRDRFKYTLEKISNRVVKLELNGAKQSSVFYLFPKRIASAGFTGNIVSIVPNSNLSFFTAGRAANGLGGIQIIINNLNDKAQEYTETTDENGVFSTNDTIPDEPYQINTGGSIIDVTSPGDGGDVGTITVTDGINFKTSVITQQKDLYVGEQFTASLSISNVGTATAQAATYQITLDNGLILNSGSLTGIFGSIPHGNTSNVRLNLTCNSIEGESGFKKIYIQIKDPISNKIWTDSVSIYFYKTKLTLGIRAESHKYNYYGNRVNVIVITPRNESYIFTTNHDGYSDGSIASGKGNFPRMKGDYYIAVLPVSGEQPIYRIYLNGITSDSGFSTDAANFLDTGNYEPNNTEDTAVLITDNILSYLHTGDIDFYKFRVE